MMLIRLDAKRNMTLALMLLVAMLLALASAKPANSALLDSAFIGNGVSGTYNPTSNGYINETAPIIAAANAGSTQITVGTRVNSGYANSGAASPNATSDKVNFGSGRLILIIQTQGHTGSGAACSGATGPGNHPVCSGDQVPLDLSTAQNGRWEIARITGAVSNGASNTVNLTEPLGNSYAASGAQIVSIPEFTTVSLAASRTLSARPWNGSSGGILAFLANGAVTMGAGAVLSANAAGFRGATVPTNAAGTNCIEYNSTTRNGYKGEGILSGFYGGTTNRAMGNRANGAGGGNCENSGGGGGGNAGQGGQGGLSFDSGSEQWPVGGLGGQSLVYTALDHAWFGGGGGSGDANNTQAGAGGAGGGIVFVRAQSLSGTGTLSADGAAGSPSGNVGASDGAGGGGAGGVVSARFAAGGTCTAATARGGNGGTERSTAGVHGPGGGGGGGYVLVQMASGTCPANSNAGSAGTTTNGTPGSSRGAGPSSPTDPSSIGGQTTVAEGFSLPTASVAVPAAAQTVAINSVFSGTATATSTVRVYLDGAYHGSTISDGSGNWTYNSPALSGGSHTIYVIPVRLGVAGAQAPTPSRTFSVDATPPAPPVITNPGGALITNDDTPSISGTAEANSTLHFFDGGNALAGTATANGSGNWSFTLPSLTYGAHSITATATDIYGNQGVPSIARSITYDNIPAVLTVSAPTENAFVATKTPAVDFSSNKPGSSTCQLDAGLTGSCSSGWTIPGSPTPSEGAHTATVRWTDAAGNVTTVVRNFTIDTINPVVDIYSPATDGVIIPSSRPAIGFNITDVNEGTSECRADGQPFATCDSPWTAPTLADGTHAIQIRHTDAAGNQSTSTRSIEVDTTLPTVNITAPANSSFTGPNPIVSFTVTDDNAGTSYCQIDGGAENPCTSGNAWVPPLAAGSHNLAVRHEDAAGNNGPTATVSFIVDTTAPTVAINGPAEGQLVTTTSPQVLFTLTEANPSASSSCIIDGGAAQPCTSPWVASGLSQGAHTLVVSHSDKAGNVGTSATRNFTVDSIAPNAPTFDSGPGGAPRLTNQTGANFTFTPAEPGGHLACQLDGNGWTDPCTSPQSFAGLSVGEHSFFVRQYDAAGNPGQIGTYTWTIDQTPPPAPIVAGPSGVSGSPVETFTFYNAEQGVTFTCQLDGGATSSCNSLSFTTPTLANGPHTFSVYSTDQAGNQSATTTLNWSTNLAAFYTTITGTPNALSMLRDGDIAFSSSIYGATFHCSLDGAPASVCTSPFSYSSLTDGSHTFSVYATQGAEQTTTVSYTWSIDATPPSVDVTQPAPEGVTTGGTLNLLFTASDAGGVTTTCVLDGAPASACSSGLAMSNLSGGAHSITVTATDAAGNQTAVTRNWTVDAVPPQTTFDSTPPSATNNPAASFSFSANKGPATFECSLDGAGFTSCTSPMNFSVSEGIHTFQARATTYGNTDASPASFTWNYDATPPAPPVLASGTTILSGSSITLRGTSETDSDVDIYFVGDGAVKGTGLTAPNGNWDITIGSLVDGTYTICARATDPAGNTSGCSTPITLLVDTVAPSVSISSPLGGELRNQSTVTFSGSDATSNLIFECKVDNLDTITDTPAFELCSPPSFAPELASGYEYEITVRATDQLENSASDVVIFEYDDTPPSKPTITNPATDGATNGAPVTIGGSTEADAVVTVYLDGSPLATTTTANGSGDWSYTFSPDLAEQVTPYEIHVVARDAANNSSVASETRTLTVDRTAPGVPTIATPVDFSGTTDTTPTFTGTAEAGSTLHLTISGSPVDVAVDGSGNWTYTPSVALNNGTHIAYASAEDAAGNESAQSANTTFAIDDTAPVVAISSPLGGAHISSTNVTVNFTATDNNPLVAEDNLICSLDGNATTCDGPPSKSLTGLSQGSHTFQVQAFDWGGSVSTAAVTFVVDTVAPAAPVIVGPADDSYVSGTSVLVNGTAEANASLELALSGGPTVTIPVDNTGHWSFTFSGLTDQVYTVTAEATDAAGNTGPSTSSDFTLDNVAPSAPVIDSPADGARVSSLSSVSGHGAEAGAEVTVNAGAFNGSTNADGSGNWSIAVSPAITTDSLVTVTAFQTDAGGNDGAVATASVTIDATAPSASISSPTAGGYVIDATPDISFSASDTDPSLTTQCRVDADAFAACTSPWTTPTLTEGSHNAEVRATDSAGNSATATVSFTVDLTAPDTLLGSNLPGDGGQPDSDVTPTFDFSSSDATATFRCKVDAGSWVVCASPFTIEAVGQGAHTFFVKAVDAAGNEDLSPASHTWTADSMPPAKPVITDPTNGTITGDNTPTITGTAEPLSTVSIRIDGNTVGTTSATAGGTWSFTVSSALNDGPRVFTATATDAAGNISPLSAAVSVTIDAIDPVVSISSHPDALSNVENPTFEFSTSEVADSYECKLDGGSWYACATDVTPSASGSDQLSLSSQGSHTFTVRATDLGMRLSNETSFTWTFDSIAPTKPVITAPATSNPSVVLADSTPTISGTAEAGSTVEVFVDSSSIGSVTATGGTWSITSPSLTDGAHTVRANATDGADNTSADSDATPFEVDTTPPVGDLTQVAGSGLNGTRPSFVFFSDDPAATKTCSIDSASPVACTSPWTPSYDLAAGAHSLTVTFTDAAGNSSAKVLAFTTTSATTPPPPPAKPEPTACFPKGITITDLAVVGSKVKLTGFALPAFVGQTVSIFYKASKKKAVGKAVVAADGSFSASFKAPAKKLRASKKTAYRASVADTTTAWTQLTRRMLTTSATYVGGRLVIKGAVSKPLFPKAKASVTVRTGCNDPWTRIGSAKISSSGKFSLSLPYTQKTSVVFVQVSAIVGSKPKKPKKIKTNSFVIPVIVK